MLKFLINSKRVVVFAIVLLILISCNKAKKTYSIEEKNGVSYIHNTKTELADIELQQDLKISDEDMLFSQIVMIKEDKKGNIYVLDRKENKIVVFDYSGKFIKQIGGSGKGPGEFDGPVAMGFLKSGNMVVSDSGNRRYQIFDKRGNFIKSYKIDPDTPGSFVIDDNDRIINNSTVFSLNSKKDAPPIFKVYNDSLNQIGEIGKRKHYSDAFKSYIMSSNSFVSFQNIIFVAYSAENYILIFDKDKLTKKIDRILQFAPKKADIKSTDDNGALTFSASYDPISFTASVDSKGNFYVLTNGGLEDKKRKMIIEIYDNNGILIKLIPVNDISPRQIYIGKDDKIYLNDNEEMTIYRFNAVL